MQTLLAFAFHEPPTPERIAHATLRVESWYEPLWRKPTRARGTATGRVGMRLWDDPSEPCRWPAWTGCADRAVATLHIPFGWTRLIGDVDLDRAPLALATQLAHAPADVLTLTAPFVLADLVEDSQTMRLVTDGLGLGRLFEVCTPEGRFWSNRPVAALRFAGSRAEADPLAWRRMAACDWAMGEATPYAGVRTVPAATQIVVDADGTRESSLDVASRLWQSRRDPLTPESLAQTSAGLVELARTTARLWPDPPVLSLSGGRDSRLVVAAFLAAGVDFTLKTFAGAEGEAATARELVSRLPRPVPHSVVTPGVAAGAATGRRGAYERARQWHDVTEGLRPALYLRGIAPRRLLQQRPVLICGVGGEFGHAPGYPDDVERLEQLPPPARMAAWTAGLQAKIVLPRGISDRGRDEVQDQIDRVLQHAATRGLGDAKALDWFYADERLRRWGMAGESFGRVLPLLTPEFVSAALGLTTAQSIDSALHRALIESLVPEWAGVEFYSAKLRARSAVTETHLWQEPDRDLLGGIIEHSDDWTDGFDPALVRSIWRRASAGRAAARDKLLLQRVVWRAAFTDHLAAVNDDPPVPRRPAVAREPQAPARPAARPAHSLAVWANDIPLARRAARTSVGRWARRRLGV